MSAAKESTPVTSEKQGASNTAPVTEPKEVAKMGGPILSEPKGGCQNRGSTPILSEVKAGPEAQPTKVGAKALPVGKKVKIVSWNVNGVQGIQKKDRSGENKKKFLNPNALSIMLEKEKP